MRAEGAGDLLDAEAQAGHGERHRKLDGELGAGSRAAQIVVDAQEADDSAPGDEAEGAAPVGVEQLAHRGVGEEEPKDGDEEGSDDGDAAEARHRAPVHLA